MRDIPQTSVQRATKDKARLAAGWLVLLSVAAAFGMAWQPTRDVAEQMGADPRTSWLAPFVIEGGMAVSALAGWTLQRHGLSVRLARALLAFLVALSVAVQTLHGLQATSLEGLPRVIGAALAASPSVVVLGATELLIALTFPPEDALRKGARRPKRSGAAASTPDPAPVPAPSAPRAVAAPSKQKAVPATESRPRLPVTDEVLAEALARRAQGAVGWGTLADEFWVSKTTLRNRARKHSEETAADAAV